QPERLNLLGTQTLPSNVKAIAAAGSCVLSLSKGTLSLRKISNLKDVLAQTKVEGSQMTFASVQKRAYITKENDKKTEIQPFKIFSNSLAPVTPMAVDGSFARCSAHG